MGGGAVAAWPIATLNLSGNALGADALPLLEALRSHRYLRELRLQHCRLPLEAGGVLGELAMSAPALLLLNLSGNSTLGAAGAFAFVEASLRQWGQLSSTLHHLRCAGRYQCLSG